MRRIEIRRLGRVAYAEVSRCSERWSKSDSAVGLTAERCVEDRRAGRDR